MNNKKIVFGTLIAVVVIIIVAVFIFRSSIFDTNIETGVVTTQEVSTNEPVDIALDFYNEWLEARRSTSTNPYQAQLAVRPILSEELRNRLVSTEGQATQGIDPVLCHSAPPMGVNGRIVSKREDSAQILIMSKDKTVYEQAVYTLRAKDGGWYIDDITCSPGEFAPDREFSFDMEGYLLKDVPPPLDPGRWYIVFEDNNELGHYAPLIVSASSSCKAMDGTEKTCDQNEFIDAKKVHLYGQMLEEGIDVTRIEFLE